MKIVITAATSAEWMPAFLNIKPRFINGNHPFKILFHESGVGMLATTFSLTKLIIENKPDFIMQVGIAGTFDPTFALGKTVIVQDEIVGDMGVVEENNWKDIFDLSLEKSNHAPFKKSKLPNQNIIKFNLLKLPQVTAVTVNEISTNLLRIQQLKKKYNPVIESMEGAAFHYVCTKLKVPFVQIRTVSNYVGDRNKKNWEMQKSITNLNKIILKYVDKLYKIM